MTDKPLVSIIIPTKNSEPTIKKCLESIKGQTYRNIEIIVVDNHSTDKTRKIALKYADKILLQGGGMGVQVNKGIDAAEGEYIAYFDCDMYLSERAIEECLAKAEKGYDAIIIPERCVEDSFWAKCRGIEKLVYEGKLDIEAARFYKKTVFKSVGGIDEKLKGYRDFDVHQKVKNFGARIGRISDSKIVHGVTPSLREILVKRISRAETFYEYAKRHPNHSKSIILRTVLVKQFPKVMAQDPIHGMGLYVLKTLEYLSSSMGLARSFLWSFYRRWRKSWELITLAILFFSFSYFIYGGLLAEGDTIVNGDLTVSPSSETFLRQIAPMWNDQRGSSNLIRLPRLGVYLLFFIPVIPSTLDILFITAVSLATVAGVSMYYLSKTVLLEGSKGNNTKNLNIASLASSFVYFFSTYVVESSVHPGIVYAYYLAPLTLLTLVKGLEKNEKKYTLLSALLWSISIVDTHWMFFGFLLLTGFIIYDFISQIIIYPKGYSVSFLLKKNLFHLALLFGFFFLFSSYWLLPGLLSGGSSRYGNVLTLEGLKSWFRNAGVANLFAMKGNYNLSAMYGDIPEILHGIYLNLLLYLIVILGSCSILFGKIKKYKVYFLMLFIFSVGLSAGPNFFEGFYNWFMFDAPLHSLYAWAFRTSKIHQFIILAIAPLVGFTYLEISKKVKKHSKRMDHFFAIAFLTVILISALMPNYPLLTGNMNGNLKPTKIPMEFKKINTWLGTQIGDFKVFWAPQYLKRPEWNHNPAGAFTEALSEKPCYYGWNDYYLATLGIEHPFKSVLSENSSRHIEKFYSPLNVKYLIIHNDIPEMKSEVNLLLGILKGQNGLKLVKEQGFISVFELNDYSEHIKVKDKTLSIYGGLRNYNSLTYVQVFNPIETAVIYEDLKITNLQPDILLLEDPLDVEVDNFLSKAIILKPFDHTNHYNPDGFWSKVTLSLIDSSIDFRNELHKHELENLQFDYGMGLVFTRAPHILGIPFIVENTGTYDLYVRYFRNEDGGIFVLYLDGTQIEIIDTKDQINRFTWKKIGTYNLDREKHTLILENREGFNAVNLFALIPQEEAAKTEERVESLIQNKRIIYILEAESDMYGESSPTSNKYGGEASNGEVIELTPTSKVWNQLEILKPGNYTIVIRGKGNLNVKIDGNEYTANSAQLDWTYLGPVSLEKGKHEIEITPSLTHYSHPSDLDVVWLYSTKKENETLEEIFTPKENPAEIISYQKIDPTKYIVEVNATKPFMLSFAEAYDPPWIAYVNGERIESIPLYSVINGFWINQTGQLEITIEYEPQKWLYYGSIISVTTFLVCLTYLTYNWTKNKTIWKRTKRSIARVRLILHLNRRKKKIQHRKA